MNENDILYEIDEFESVKDFISVGINLAKYDIVFLDVNMDEPVSYTHLAAPFLPQVPASMPWHSQSLLKYC